MPDDAVRNLIRQAKIEQIYSVMQTNTSRGMLTMEQSLADLVQRRVDHGRDRLRALVEARSAAGILERAGFSDMLARSRTDPLAAPPPPSATPACGWRGRASPWST